ncbi:MAG: hypothetical protein LQ337_000517 [Flavoplaca oasis]|nr:MAG: hypothetical protein LQ337_000517 [Flavoplaca oasis]
MAFHSQPTTYIPHTDFDPAYGPTYPAQPYSLPHPQHQQPPYHPSYHQPHPHQQPHQFPQPHAQRSHHAPQYQMPNPAHGHGPPPPPPGSMPPPSSIPENSLYRQNYAYASAPRTPDRWPLGTTDDQPQMQEQYRQQGRQPYQGNEPAFQAHQLTSITSLPAQTPQHHPSYLPQPSPTSTVTPAGPVSSFPLPTQTRSPSQVQPPSQSPRIVNSPPSTSQPSQQPMTTPAAKTLPQSNSPFPTPTKEPAAPASSSPPSISLESQRVSALLELNRVLIQEVVALQESQKESKAVTSVSQTQPIPPQTSPPATEASANEFAQPKPDATSSAKDTGESNGNTNDHTSTSTASKSSQPQPHQQNKPPNNKEYIGYMRRLQANLAYLASIADRHNKPGNPGPPFPAIMEAPDTAEVGGEDSKGGKENMKELYAKLRELWPDYVKGKVNTPSGTAVGTATTTTATTTTTTTTIPATTTISAPTTTAAANTAAA